MRNTTDFKEESQIGWEVTNRASKAVSADWTNPRLIERARLKHKHQESKYTTCRARRYLAGLGTRLRFWDDLHGDDTVGFFLQANTTVDKTLEVFKFIIMRLQPVLQPIIAFTFHKQTWLTERTSLCDVTKGCNTSCSLGGKLPPTRFPFVPLTAALFLALQLWQEKKYTFFLCVCLRDGAQPKPQIKQ